MSALDRLDLAGEMAAANQAAGFAHLRRLNALGVGRHYLAEMGLRQSFGSVRATAAEDGVYLPGEGSTHLLLPVVEDGTLVDLCAFRSPAPGAWLLRTGLGWALGLERGLERHTWGDPVPIAATPLDWLRGDGEGLCILDWDAPEVRYLDELPEVICSSEALVAQLRTAISKPVRFPKISVREISLAA